MDENLSIFKFTFAAFRGFLPLGKELRTAINGPRNESFLKGFLFVRSLFRPNREKNSLIPM